MWNFDAGEIFFLLFAGLSTIVWLALYTRALVSTLKRRSSLPTRSILAITPIACFAFTYFTIQAFADPQVRGHPDYITLFLLGQGLWLAITCFALRLLGLDIAENIVERSNPPALLVAVAAMIATTIIYAGSNIGSGPTIWTTIVPATLCTILLGFIWIMINWLGDCPIDAITIDRDAASALRVAGALIACAIILARADAGRWISWRDTFLSLCLMSWPVLILAAAAGAAHRFFRPTPELPRPPQLSHGVVPAAIFLLFALLILFLNQHPFHPSQW